MGDWNVSAFPCPFRLDGDMRSIVVYMLVRVKGVVICCNKDARYELEDGIRGSLPATIADLDAINLRRSLVAWV